MKKRVGKLAQRYARALLRVVSSEVGSGGSAAWEKARAVAQELENFSKIWEEQQEFRFFLLNPSIAKPERTKAILAIAQKLNLSAVTTRFLRVLSEADRLLSLPEIAAGYVALANEEAGVIQVSIVTATAVDAGEQKDIETELRGLLKGAPEFHWSLDKNLLGGMVIQYNGKVIDGSISGRLNRLEQVLV